MFFTWLALAKTDRPGVGTGGTVCDEFDERGVRLMDEAIHLGYLGLGQPAASGEQRGGG